VPVANGTAGDHPITDIVIHGLAVFSPEVDALIAEIDALGGWESEFAALEILSWHSAWQDLRGKDPEAAASSLANLRSTLLSERDRLLGK